MRKIIVIVSFLLIGFSAVAQETFKITAVKTDSSEWVGIFGIVIFQDEEINLFYGEFNATIVINNQLKEENTPSKGRVEISWPGYMVVKSYSAKVQAAVVRDDNKNVIMLFIHMANDEYIAYTLKPV